MSTTYQKQRSRYLEVPGGSVRVIQPALPVTMKCREHDRDFDLTDDLHYVYNTNCTYVWCPVCGAHGNRKVHLVFETWSMNGLMNEPATAVTVPVQLEA